eukprot:UN14766
MVVPCNLYVNYSEPLDRWKGIGCNRENGLVEEISLCQYEYSLTGSIPTSYPSSLKRLLLSGKP